MKITYLAVASMFLFACAGDPTNEEDEAMQLTSASTSCKPTAKVGTAEWRAQLKACIQERTEGADQGETGSGTAGKDGTSSSSSSGCRVSIKCDPECHCNNPGLPQTPCSGNTCGTVCKVCN